MSAGAVPKAATAAATEKEEPMASSYSPEQKALVEKGGVCGVHAFLHLFLSHFRSNADWPSLSVGMQRLLRHALPLQGMQ